MNPEAPKKPQHDEVEQYAQAEASQEPQGGDFNILVSIPESIEVKMVNATALSDYEIWFFSASALLSFLTGFLVAYIQETEPRVAKVHGVVTLIFTALFLGCFVMTLFKRHQLQKKEKTIRLKTSKATEVRKG